MELAIPKNVSFVSLFFKFLHFWRENDVTKFLIDLVSKLLQTTFFAIVAKKITEKKLCQKITYKYRETRKKITNLTRIKTLKKEAKKDPEMSTNTAIIAKVTRIFLAN